MRRKVVIVAGCGLLVGAIGIALALDPARHEPAPSTVEGEDEAPAAAPASPPADTPPAETPPPEAEPFVARPIELFTHFPMDFAGALGEPRSIDVTPIAPFFIPIYNGTEKWYL